MEQETQTVSTEQQTSTDTQTEATPQTLDDVYKQYNVEEQATTFQPQRQTQQNTQQQTTQQTAPQVSAIPDPVLDPVGYKAWHGQQNGMVQQALSQIAGELNVLKVERTKQREEADIKGAVQAFRKVVGEGIDDDMAEVALGARARKDPKFLAVYNNRQSNPQAWNAAVGAYANEFKSKVQFKIDPQLAENVRAAKQSVQGSQSTRPTGATGDAAFFEGKTGREFDAAWSQYISRNQN